MSRRVKEILESIERQLAFQAALLHQIGARLLAGAETAARSGSTAADESPFKHGADVQRIVDGNVSGEAAVQILRLAIVEEDLIRDAGSDYRVLIERAEQSLVYGADGRPLA